MKIKVASLISALWAFSTLLYAFRGKLGAIMITICIIASIPYLLRQTKKDRSWASIYAALFLLVFAVVVNIFRSISLEYYLIIGYFATALVLLNYRIDYFNDMWKWFKGIAVFEAIGVYMQFFLPSLYYPIISIVLPGEVVASIQSRLLSGYYTGFSHEVSFTMFLIVVGLGLYIYEINSDKKAKKWIPIVLLVGALFISGKRATQLFFIIALFVTQFIRSDDKLKLLKYSGIAAAGLAAIWFSYPWWSKIPAFERINQLISFYSSNDIIGMTSGRTVIYENAIKLWQTNKWFGIGWGNFKYSVSDMLWYSGFDVHNCFLQILCETGIIGLVFYSILILIVLFNSIRCVLLVRRFGVHSEYNLSVFYCYIQIFFILYSITEPILYEYTDYFIFFVCFNCSNLLLKNKGQKKQDNYSKLLIVNPY